MPATIDKFYVVWNPSSGYTKYKHDCVSDARREAERLAWEHPGQEFHVLTTLGCALVTQPSIWTPAVAIEETLPF